MARVTAAAWWANHRAELDAEMDRLRAETIERFKNMPGRRAQPTHTQPITMVVILLGVES